MILAAVILLSCPISLARSQAADATSAAEQDPGAGASEGAFVKGSVSALLREILGIHEFTISLEARTLELFLDRQPEQPSDRILRNLVGVRGIDHVQIYVGERLLASGSATASPTAEAPGWGRMPPQKTLLSV